MIDDLKPYPAYKPSGVEWMEAIVAPPVIRKVHKRGTPADPLRGLFETTLNGAPAVVEYESDTDLRDTEHDKDRPSRRTLRHPATPTSGS